ncbi:LLM class flavin-dependent oxidoreductase [Baekduia soli]|uniref:LLM class flavin-dependent oxidoreductase n=2 Tax=Baekduia soli TaxID=496014 RepID=A0A5B8UBW4_9ACTN|nr:LLM class flavin-dependent oxidoreductase [Baekduia soli]
MEESRELAVVGQDYGFDWISVADSPTVYQESFLHQLEIARIAERPMIGPLVSHVVVRHPVIVGNLLATLNEFTGGRVIGTLATGNSAARGLGMKPARLAEVAEAITCIQGYWRGEGGTFGESRIPATGIERQGCPILVSADGPKAAELSGQVGDGLLYGGVLDPGVRRRRLAAAKITGDREAWIAPSVSMFETYEDVNEDLGAVVVAMCNRAMRGDLSERDISPEIEADILALRKAYDYGFHADNTRGARNATVIGDRLRNWLIDQFCIWGDEERFAATLDDLAEEGWTGIQFLIGQGDQVATVRRIGERLRKLGYVSGSVPAA